MMGTNRENESQYNVAFYFAPNAETLEDITDPDSIVRISASTPDGTMFNRQYASQFYVSNTFNRVRVQKLDYHGDRLTGAEFSMYQTYSTWKRNDNYELVNTNSTDTAHIGMYRNTAVVNEDGTLKDREEILTTSCWDKGTTKSGGSAGAGSLDLDGAFIFPTAFDTYIFSDEHLSKHYQVELNDTSTYIEEGEYVIFETTAPSAGYLINETPVSVTINDDGVFADAGEVNDGVRVGQYAGWVLNSMSQFATEGPVDETLTFLSNTLQIRNEDGSLTSPIEGEITWLNKYSNENDRYIFLAEDIGRYITDGRNLYQFTDEGTPQLRVQQDSDVTAKMLLLDGAYENYDGPVLVSKQNADDTIYLLQGVATDGTLGFWLQKGKNGTTDGGQTLAKVEIDGKVLVEGVDYHVYTPDVIDLSGYKDLSGLFSIETLVQVYDQSVGNLEVSKKTEKVAADSDADEELFFYRVYSVYEHATRVVLAETNDDGSILLNGNGTPVLNNTFTGTLNVRLRQDLEEESFQMTATDVAVDFTNGVGTIYLEPSYAVEHIYIPENEDHDAYGLIGWVETQVTLSDPVTGKGAETGKHIAFDIFHKHDVDLVNGVGILYHDPAFAIETVTINGETYYADPAAGQKSLVATSRFNYANIEQVQNLSVDSEAKIYFLEADGTPSSADRILTGDENLNVTVVSDGNNGYLLEYDLPSETYEQAVVAQFALYGGQTIHIENLAGGTVYYVYEYAAGDGSEDGTVKLVNDWNTEIVISPQGANQGTEDILDDYEMVIQDELPEYRAARGVIRPNSTQKVEFTNTGRVGALCISKTVSGAQITETDKQKAFSFTVSLTNPDGTPLKGTYSYVGSAVDGVSAPEDSSLTLDETGNVTFSLSHGQSITIRDIPKGTLYEVSESDAGGFTVIVDGDTDGDGAAEGTIVEDEMANVKFHNTKQTAFIFIKVAAEDHTNRLSDANFALFELVCADNSHDHSQVLNPSDPGSCWKFIAKASSGNDGSVTFPTLQPDTVYRLVETKAPVGYMLPDGQWAVITDASNAFRIETISGQDGSLPTAFAVEDETGTLLLPNVRPRLYLHSKDESGTANLAGSK